MKRSALKSVAAALMSAGCLFLAPTGASADEHWVINATFTDGGTLTGFIDFNTYGQVGNFNLQSSAVGTFPGFDFTPGHGNVAPSGGGAGTTTVELFGPGYNIDNLVLNASAPFTASLDGNHLLATTVECVAAYSCSPGAGTRYLSGPSLLAVPEPAAWALMAIGFGGVGAASRRRRHAIAA